MLVATDDCQITAWYYDGSGYKNMNPLSEKQNPNEIPIFKS